MISHTIRDRDGVGSKVTGESELADKTDFRLEVLAELPGDTFLDVRDQLSDIRRRGTAKVDNDVGMEPGHLRVSNAMALEPALIDQASSADILDLLEDRSRAGVNVEPWMTGTAPGEVFLENTVHAIAIAVGQFERDGQGNITMVVQDARIVTERHLIAMNDATATFLG